jgi:hypothetical protein
VEPNGTRGSVPYRRFHCSVGTDNGIESISKLNSLPIWVTLIVEIEYYGLVLNTCISSRYCRLKSSLLDNGSESVKIVVLWIFKLITNNINRFIVASCVRRGDFAEVTSTFESWQIIYR